MLRLPISLTVAAASCVLIGQVLDHVPSGLPAAATAQLEQSLAGAHAHVAHVWRDTPPLNGDGTVNAFVEISRGDWHKWEFDMRTNALGLDRLIPADVGGYPVNYGFVPQTVSYDGDPFDALVLGAPLPRGGLVRGAIVGLMLMEDEKGLDSKVVLSPVGSDGRPLHRLTPDEQRRIGGFFKAYKRHDPGGFSKVPGWGSMAQGRDYVTTTHAFFTECRRHAGRPCNLRR